MAKDFSRRCHDKATKEKERQPDSVASPGRARARLFKLEGIALMAAQQIKRGSYRYKILESFAAPRSSHKDG